MSTDHVSTPTPPDSGDQGPAGPPKRVLLLIAAVAVAVAVIILAVVLASGGGSDESSENTTTSQAGVKPGPPPVQTVSGMLVAVDASGAKDAKSKVAGRQVGLWTIGKNGKADRETQTSVTGGDGAFFFLKTDLVKPGAKFIIKADKGAPMVVTIPEKGAVKTTLKVCFSCR